MRPDAKRGAIALCLLAALPSCAAATAAEPAAPAKATASSPGTRPPVTSVHAGLVLMGWARDELVFGWEAPHRDDPRDALEVCPDDHTRPGDTCSRVDRDWRAGSTGKDIVDCSGAPLSAVVERVLGERPPLAPLGAPRHPAATYLPLPKVGPTADDVGELTEGMDPEPLTLWVGVAPDLLARVEIRVSVYGSLDDVYSEGWGCAPGPTTAPPTTQPLTLAALYRSPAGGMVAGILRPVRKDDRPLLFRVHVDDGAARRLSAKEIAAAVERARLGDSADYSGSPSYWPLIARTAAFQLEGPEGGHVPKLLHGGRALGEALLAEALRDAAGGTSHFASAMTWLRAATMADPWFEKPIFELARLASLRRLPARYYLTNLAELDTAEVKALLGRAAVDPDLAAAREDPETRALVERYSARGPVP